MPFLKDKSKLKSRSKELEYMTKKNGLRHGVYSIPGDKYVGEWFDNTKNGKGFLLTRTCRFYDGHWEKNFRGGFGVFALPQENNVFILEYRGDWKRGKKSGFGAQHYPDGSFYLGYFKNGMRHGYGRMWNANGSFYDGDFLKDLKHGLGMWVRPDGNRYEGAWEFDLKHGKGRFFYLNSGQMQEGVWQQDVCVYSYVIDIPFRQTAVAPTPFPIQNIKLVSASTLCTERELETLAGHIKSCLQASHTTLPQDEFL